MSLQNLFYPNNYNLFCNNLTANNIAFTGTTFSGDLIFTADNTYNIASTTDRVKEIFTYDINIKNFQLLFGSTGNQRTILVNNPGSNDTMTTNNDTQTLINKTLTSPVISTIINTGTLTVPTITDTLVARTTTDTLSNKTLTAPIINNASIFSVTNSNLATCTFNNTAGNDIVFQFESSGINNNLMRFSPGTLTNFIAIESGTPSASTQGYLYVDNILAYHNSQITIGGGFLLPSPGGTASPFNYYQSTTYSTTFTWGSFTSSSITINIVRVGIHVTLVIPALSFTSTQNSIITSVTAMPSQFRLTNSISMPVQYFVSGTGQLGLCNITSAGLLSFESPVLVVPSGTSFATNAISLSWIFGV